MGTEGGDLGKFITPDYRPSPHLVKEGNGTCLFFFSSQGKPYDAYFLEPDVALLLVELLAGSEDRSLQSGLTSGSGATEPLTVLSLLEGDAGVRRLPPTT